MRKYKISNIKYDITDSMGLASEEGVSLPKSMTIFCESEDEIADTISDGTGFLVESFVIDSVENV